MTRWLGQLAALPLKILLILVSIVPILDRIPLYQAIWSLTRDPYYGRNLILLLAQKRGMNAARSFAEKAFSVCPDGSMAAMIGQIELELAGNLDYAAAWLRGARAYPGFQNPDGLLPLELSLSHLIPSMDCAGVVESILARKDLSMDLTRLALLTKAQLELKAGQWASALEIADRILGVSEFPLAHMIRWVAYSATYEPTRAEQEMDKLTVYTLGPLYDVIIASGYNYLGDTTRCREHLLKARKAGIPDRLIQLNDPNLVGHLSELPPSTESSEASS